METIYEVFEERGTGIEYVVYSGTLNNCNLFVEAEIRNQKNDFYKDSYYNNVNGKPFTWTIRKDIF